ncbi:MAG: CvpA family protein [Pseudohongiella sp.]|nr:CvpA family protein [Pseudohongiella sp.]MDO9521534.1 CvpA family protein [Pseudohongiella sp.]MDP2127720.1 CvpA family protein [Pseudohongiella sp.]
MSLLDICILIVIGISSIFGLSRGFIREVLAVIAWVAAIYVARLYSPHLIPFFESIVENETGRYVLAFAVLCLATLIVGAVVNKFMSRLVSMAGLQVTDRLLGAVFGVARGVIIVAVLVYFAYGQFSQESWWTESQTIPHMLALIEWAGFVPGESSAGV